MQILTDYNLKAELKTKAGTNLTY